MGNTTLLDKIQAEHANLEALIAPLSETQLCSPSLEEGWSIKDILGKVGLNHKVTPCLPSSRTIPTIITATMPSKFVAAWMHPRHECLTSSSCAF